MVTRLDPKTFDATTEITWCPGCGDFAILRALKLSLADQMIAPYDVLVVSGIGCGSKLPDYMNANGLMTIHGRPLPVATGAKLANPDLHVVVVNGDGDSYGIGGNHFLHACRRNPNITQIVENNQIYGLTKGQYSPTSERGFVTTTSPEGAIELAVNPMAVALACGAGFIARAFAGDPKQLSALITEAMEHRGYALIDVLQPCVTFNKLNTYDWYRQRIYKLDETYDASDPDAAWEKAHEWEERIPTGVLYRREGVPTYEDHVPQLQNSSPVKEMFNLWESPNQKQYEPLKEQFL